MLNPTQYTCSALRTSPHFSISHHLFKLGHDCIFLKYCKLIKCRKIPQGYGESEVRMCKLSVLSMSCRTLFQGFTFSLNMGFGKCHSVICIKQFGWWGPDWRCAQLPNRDKSWFESRNRHLWWGSLSTLSHGEQSIYSSLQVAIHQSILITRNPSHILWLAFRAHPKG